MPTELIWDGKYNADVARKDARAVQWCADATLLTEVPWAYLKIPQKEFSKLKPRSLGELSSALQAGGPLLMMDGDMD